MLLTHRIRLPLSTGASVVQLGLGVAGLGFLGGGPIFFGSVLPDWTVYPVGLMAGLWALALIFAVPAALWNDRASDLVIDDSGVRIEGGRFHGRCFAWSALDRISIDQTDNGGVKLWLTEDTFAATEVPDEAASLIDLAATLQALGREALAPRELPAPLSTRADLLRCQNCGAAVLPGEGQTVACGHCHTAVQMPELLRAEVAALHALGGSRSRVAGALKTLLRWPRAGRVNVLLLAAIPPLAICWPIAGSVFDEFFQTRHQWGPREGAMIFAAALAGSLGLLLLAQAQVVNRRAVSLLVARFRALPPEAQETAHRCRNCGAPLRRELESPIAACAYCRCENLIAIDLPAYAAPEVIEAEALDARVGGFTRARRTWTWLAIAAALLVVGSVGLLHRAAQRLKPPAAVRSQPSGRAAFGMSRAGISMSRAGVGVSRAAVGVSRAGISTSRAGISTSRAGVGVSRAGFGMSRTAVGVSRAGISTSRPGFGMSRPGFGMSRTAGGSRRAPWPLATVRRWPAARARCELWD